MKSLEDSPPPPIRDSSWLSAIAADGALSHADARAAIAVANLADHDGTLKGRTATLADACRIDPRRVRTHLLHLAEAGYLRLMLVQRPGRFHVQIPPDVGEASPLSSDPVVRRRGLAAIAAALNVEDGDE